MNMRTWGVAWGGLWLVGCASSGAETPAPRDLPPRDADLYVSSRGTDSVKRFHGTTGEPLGDFVAPGAGGLKTTQEVRFGPDGHLYVSGRGTDAILKFDRDTGEFLGPFTTGYALSEPTKMTFGPDGLLYVSQWDPVRRTVARFDASSGAFVDEIAAGLRQGMDHAWDASGAFHVATFQDQEVRRYAADGAHDVVVSADQLDGPVNLWFDADGRLTVIDWERGDVLRFRTDGTLDTVWIDTATNLEGYVLAPDGRLLVGDWARSRILAFAADGTPAGVFAEGGGLSQPNSLVFGPVPPEG